MFKEYSKEEVNGLPLLKYEGEVVVVNRLLDLKSCIKEIDQYDIVGIDTESKPAFRKGEYNPISLIQIATPDKVFLLRINKTGFDQELVDYLKDPTYTKIGIGMTDDIRDLRKLKNFDPQGFVDLSKVAERIGLTKLGARNMVATLFHHRISKSQQTSNWENETLTESQISYAATDAWICLKIYNKFSEKNLIPQ